MIGKGWTAIADRSNDDAVGAYLAEIGRHPLLQPEDEIALGHAIAAGREAADRLDDPSLDDEERARLDVIVAEADEARDRFIRSNLRLVVSIARRYQFLELPLLDLIQEGNLGLITAVERFDATMGFRFSTYASWWIRQAILRAGAQKGRTIRVPQNILDMIRKVRRTEEMLRGRHGREPTTAEIADALDVDAEEVESVLMVAPHRVSLETLVGADDGSELIDFLADPDAPAPSAEILAQSTRDDVRAALSTLDDRYRYILELRFGLVGPRPLTLQEVGDELGISRERVRQIERRAMAQLRSVPGLGGLDRH